MLPRDGRGAPAKPCACCASESTFAVWAQRLCDACAGAWFAAASAAAPISDEADAAKRTAAWVAARAKAGAA